jgi:hypothetical protein
LVSAAARRRRWRRRDVPAATATTGDEREAYTVLRACFVNPLTTRADVEALVELTIHLARVVRFEGET